jgi:ferrous iron transport protein B
VVGRAVVDGLIGLVGIVVPYMIPLVMLLVSLEQVGLMQRIAFVVDRGFHRIGLHGGVAVPFLLGLGCNVPAISGGGAAYRRARAHDRLGADHLRALLGALGHHPGHGRQVSRRRRRRRHVRPGLLVAVLPATCCRGAAASLGPAACRTSRPMRLPRWRGLLAETWNRTSDILTIVTPLLVGGSVLLALLAHFGADGRSTRC